MKTIFIAFFGAVLLAVSGSASAGAVYPDGMDSPVKFDHITTEQGLSNNMVSSIARDDRGFMWFGSSDGLNRYDGSDFKVYRHDPDDPASLSQNSIRTLYKDRAGNLWIGTRGGGLNRFVRETETFIRYRRDPDNPHGLGHDNILSICEDRDGALWVGTDGGGLNRLDRGTGIVARYRHDPADPNSLSGDSVAFIHEDRAGILWVGVKDGGLDTFDRKTKSFTRRGRRPESPDSPGDNRVTCIHEDRAGGVWVGSDGGGIELFDRKNEKFIPYTKNDGLSGNTVHAILEDRRGCIWFSTNHGLTIFNPHSITFRSLNVDDGARGNRFNVNAYGKSEGGALFFGGADGVTVAHPGRITDQPRIPPVVITDFQLEGKPVPIGGDSVLKKSIVETERLTLYYPDRSFSFRFAALNYRKQEKNRYRYKLEGFEEEWNEVDGSRRFAAYIHPDPGEYLFRVIASADGGPWSKEGASIRIIITPPWWGTPGFKTSMLILAAGLIFCGFLLRVRADENRKRRLEILVDKKARDLRERVKELNCLYGISHLIEKPGVSLAEILQDAVDLIPPSWQYPEITRAQIVLGNREFKAADFRKTAWRQTADITIQGEREGALEVCYLKQRPERDEGPFLEEERRLLNAVAEQLGGIIEVKRSERAIKQANKMLRTAEKAANAGSWKWELKTGGITWSENLCKLHGIAPGGFDGEIETIKEFIHPDDLDFVADKLRVMFSEKRELVFQYRILTADKELKFMECMNKLIFDEDGDITELIGMIQDVTERKQAEDALKESEIRLKKARKNADAANRAKSAFLANMNYEFRTPLSAILGFTQLLAGGENLEPEQREKLTFIRRGGELLLHLIDQTLDLSRIEAGRVTLDETDFDLRNLLVEVEDIFSSRVRNEGFALRFERAPDAPRHVRTDKEKLRRVLTHLLDNAITFTKEGAVTVRLKTSPGVSARKDPGVSQFPPAAPGASGALPPKAPGGCSLVFEVEDTGPGVAPGELKTIFKAFEQSETGGESRKGVGLGLTICREYVRMMGGEIQVESEVGRGTTFTFHIRAGVVDAGEMETGRPARRVIGLAPNQPRFRILVADDMESSRQLLIRLLKPFGFELREAINGRDAIDIWESWRPHLIWMDIRMPVLDGVEAARRIRARESETAHWEPGEMASHPAPKVGIIAITAGALKEERTAMASGCDDCLRKPFRKREVLDILAKRLGVRFEYEEIMKSDAGGEEVDKSVLVPGRLNALPGELRAALKAAAEITDPRASIRVIDRIRERDEPLAAALAGLVSKYRFDILLELLE